MIAALDCDLYLVISELPNSGPIILEVELHRMGGEAVRREIIEGQYREVLAVLQINPTENICRDVTDDFQTAIDDHRCAVADRGR